MAKSMRCKRVKRLRAIKRDIVQPYYEKKEEAKLAALEAALAAPKLPVHVSKSASMEAETPSAAASSSQPTDNTMDLDMDDDSNMREFLKPSGAIGKKMKKKLKIGKRNKKKGRGKGQIRGKRN